MWQSFKSEIQKTIEKRVPTKMTQGRHTHPWMNTAIRRKINQKQKAHKKARKTKKKRDQDRYKRLRQEVQWEIRQANKKYMEEILVLLNVLWLTTFTTAYIRPIIGVVAQKSSGGHGDTGIPADYIKWIESAGGGVVPIRDKESEEYYEQMFTYTNGVLLPGGGVNLFTSGYANASRYFYEMALKACTHYLKHMYIIDNAYDKGDYYPVWGTCLGFQELSALTAGVLVTTNASVWDKSLPLNLTEDYKESRMFGNLPDDVKTYLMKDNVTPNFHAYGVTSETYNSNSRLKKFFKVLSTNVASNGKEFLSTVEARKNKHKFPSVEMEAKH
ncbi:GGH [Mytilus edulis]|uniref:folate gamma-glutamyl hydrolase n=1 Tax=Mytilus edulis TaxID=6550 RepID=A0A8S3SWM9_MYTED|nr:GGH [Mytilus edulis]